MANIKSAKTRIGHNNRRAVINMERKSAVRTQVKKTEKAILAGDKAAATECFKKAESLLARCANRGVMKDGTAARKTSRLSKAIKAMNA